MARSINDIVLFEDNEVHGLCCTGSLCGKLKGPREKWPDNVEGVSIDQIEEMTCTDCIRQAKDQSQK